MAELAAHNKNFVSIGLSPFFTSRGLHLRMSFDVVDLLDTTTCERINKKKAVDILEAI